MKDTLTTLLTAGAGAVAVETTSVVASTIPTPETISSVGQLIVQIIIGIVTVWKLIKKPKNK